MVKLNMGFIGMGFIGPVHADAVSLSGAGVPYAVADDDPAKQKLAKDRGLKAYGSAEELINDPNVHAIHITGPDKFHAQWAIESMDAGKKVVVCEKPMTTKLEDSVKVLERAMKFEIEGGVFMVNFNYRGHALPRAAKELRQRGDLGEIEIINAVYEQDWLMSPDIWNWRVEGLMCASKDILPHLVGAAYFMGGVYPTQLTANLATIVTERNKPTGRQDAFGGGKAAETEKVKVKSDLYASVLCDFNNGGHGNFMVTQYLSGRHNWWEITMGGSKRRITWNQTNPNVMEIGQSAVSEPGAKPSPQTLGNIILINNPGNLAAMGLTDASQYMPYPGEHPAGHPDAFAQQFKTAYRVAMGELPRAQAVIPGACMGHMAVAVGDAVLRSKFFQRVWVNVDYRGVELGGKL